MTAGIALSDERIATAVHEGAHAAGALVLLGGVDQVEVRPGKARRGNRIFDTAGSCSALRRTDRSCGFAVARDRLLRHAVMTGAGFAGERMLANPRAHRQTSAAIDDIDIGNMGGILLEHEEDLPCFRRWVDLEADALVSDAAALIRAIALDLLTVDEIDGARVAFLAAELGLEPASRGFAFPDMLALLPLWEPTDERAVA